MLSITFPISENTIVPVAVKYPPNTSNVHLKTSLATHSVMDSCRDSRAPIKIGISLRGRI